MAKTPVTTEPTTYWEFLEHIGQDTLRKFPLMDQHGGTCTIFGTATGLAIANRRWTEADVPKKCGARKLTGGNYTQKDANEGLAIKDNIKRYPEETKKRFKKLSYSMVMKLNRSDLALRFANFLKEHVVVCGGVGLGYPMLDKNFKSGGKVVPGFYGNGNDSHTICIVGCYNDKDLGPCFVTKTTNECWFGTKVPTLKVGGKRIAQKYVSLAIYPAATVDKKQNNTGRASGIDEVYGLVPGEWPEEPVEDVTEQMKKMEIKNARKKRGKKLSENSRVDANKIYTKKNPRRSGRNKGKELPQLKF